MQIPKSQVWLIIVANFAAMSAAEVDGWGLRTGFLIVWLAAWAGAVRIAMRATSGDVVTLSPAEQEATFPPHFSEEQRLAVLERRRKQFHRAIWGLAVVIPALPAFYIVARWLEFEAPMLVVIVLPVLIIEVFELVRRRFIARREATARSAARRG